MPSFAVKRVALFVMPALCLPLVLASGPATNQALAQDAFDLSVPEAVEGAAPSADLECAAESLTGSGPGFASSREKSEEAAIEDWLKKAKAVYPEAAWDNAKDQNLACAVQGLYSKCFADGIPCKPKGE